MDVYIQHRVGLFEALDERHYTQEWLDSEVEAGRVAVLGNDSSAIAFYFKTYPTGWVELTGLCATGGMAEIVETLIPLAEQAAKSLGCQGCKIQSREAWVRALKPYGYELYQTIIEKEI